MNLNRYLEIRRFVEVASWIVLLSITTISETMVQIMDADRYGSQVAGWNVVIWEASSAVSLLILIPFVVYFDGRFPLKWSNLRAAIPAHIAFSVVFSVLHVSMMVGMRKGVYWFNGASYDFGIIHQQYFYEYLKDIRTYSIILLVVYLYRHLVLRLQGEASMLGAPDRRDSIDQVFKPERILVKKLGREFLIKVSDIEHLEAAGNYVNMHVGERVYPLRETLKKIEQQLDEATFRRVHRSHIVNLDHVTEIKPLETGDAHVLLRDGVVIPMSRTYRSKFIGSRW